MLWIHLKAKASGCSMSLGLKISTWKELLCSFCHLFLKEQNRGSLSLQPSVYSWLSKRKRRDSTKWNQTNHGHTDRNHSPWAPSRVPWTFMTIYFRKRATVETQLYLVLQAGVFKHQWEWLDMLSSQFIATPQVDGMFYSLVNFLRPRLDMQSLCKMVWK